VLAVSLSDIARITGGELRGGAELTVKSISTDTRSLKKGDLFVALKGDRFNAHVFLDAAAKAGAAAAVVQRSDRAWRRFATARPDFPLIVVGETLRALGNIAAMVREGLDVTAVAITGSTGKTCTKDFLTSIMSRSARVASPRGSYNNEIGVPLTILGAHERDTVLIVEMGARHVGDIERLAGMVKPDAGIITNIGVTHLEEFGSRDAILDAKSELARMLPPDGTLFLNADDVSMRKLRSRTKARVLTFGMCKGADYRAVDVGVDGKGRASFTIVGQGLSVDVRLKTPGRHQVDNALAAAACASQLGSSPSDIARGLERAKLSPWRMECVEAPGGYTVINDAYNASPQSMSAAIIALSDISSESRTIAVLGDMNELGGESAVLHREVGEKLARSGADVLIAVGRKARGYVDSWVECGMPGGSAFACARQERATEILAQIVEPGDVVLVKASRAVGLDALAGDACAEGFMRHGAADD
jgi:UDP-N-acetylmuramoyl-tripeptide--D-alanyl-D-alanine ligase